MIRSSLTPTATGRFIPGLRVSVPTASSKENEGDRALCKNTVWRRKGRCQTALSPRKLLICFDFCFDRAQIPFAHLAEPREWLC